MTKANNQQLRVIESRSLRHSRPVEVSDFVKVTKQYFNNYKRSHLSRTAHLYSNCWQSLEDYMKKIQDETSFTRLETLDQGSSSSSENFYVAFSTPCQAQLLQNSHALVLLDSTHKKHFPPGVGRLKVFFLLTNSQTL